MERIAKAIARVGIASRRGAERLIEEGKVTLNGKVVNTPATLVEISDIIAIDGKVIGQKEKTRVFRYFKPKGLITSHFDPDGRDTVFDEIKRKYPGLPRLISVGRLDLNSEGLLLLTNDGEFSRNAELPSNNWKRSYRVRIFGDFSPNIITLAKNGLCIEGVNYAPIDIELEESKKWLRITLTEGKNRTIRKVMEYFGLMVSRLIRFEYGPYKLEGLMPNEVFEDKVFYTKNK